MHKVIIVILVLLFWGCSPKVFPPVTLTDSKNTLVEKEKKETYTDEKPDSSLLKAYLKCDSLGNVYLSQIESMQGERVRQDFELAGNVATVKAKDNNKTKHTLERSDSTKTTYVEKPVPYPVIEYTNNLTQWQILQIWFGRFAMVALIALLIFNAIKGKLKGLSIVFKYILNLINRWQKKEV